MAKTFEKLMKALSIPGSIFVLGFEARASCCCVRDCSSIGDLSASWTGWGGESCEGELLSLAKINLCLRGRDRGHSAESTIGCNVISVMERSAKYSTHRVRTRFLFLATTLTFWCTLLTVHHSHDRPPARPSASIKHRVLKSGSFESPADCHGRYIYMYDLPPSFNSDMVHHCATLSPWTNWCPSVQNAGLGPPLPNTDGVFSDTDWYTTNQFMLEQIFHHRMMEYECLTRESERASAVFVPFYAGFEITTKLWRASVRERDVVVAELVEWLQGRSEWRRWGGLDHFLVGGRVTWDFRRSSDDEMDWGNKLFVLPTSANMTMLTIEGSPWHDNDIAIPYPTYFHPSSKQSLELWQTKMRGMKRDYLFSFVGAPRPELSHSIRGKIMNQCLNSKQCQLLNCRATVCLRPHKVMAVFEHSVFCLQPSGDSYTRRSTFDAMLAGCIPVFFHQHSAYDQYLWHLPSNHSSYSVLISEGGIKNDTVSIEKVLASFSREQVESMREIVIQTIPRIVYADPRTSPILEVEDAFDITVQGVIDRINKRKRDFVDVKVASPEMTREQQPMQPKSDEDIRRGVPRDDII